MEETGNILKFGNFEILKREDGANIELGRGSYGVTYKANHRYLRKIVALKVIHDRHMENAEATQRFLNEAQIVASLDHRNIARVTDFGEHDGIFFYAMEFCDGGSLEDLANKKGPMSWSKIIPLARQIAKALECAHSAGLLHRDIKPSNLMLVGESEDPVVKLIDFGLVKVLENTEKLSTFQMLSRDGGFIGNPMSAAPEQLLEEAVDARADLFSLGITLWYLLLAKSPFEGSAPAKLVHERLSDKPYNPGETAELDDHGRAILAKLVAKDPNERFASAGDLIRALDDAHYGHTKTNIVEPASTRAAESTPEPAESTKSDKPSETLPFENLRVIRRLSSNSQGVVAIVDHPRGGSIITAHANVARIDAPMADGQTEKGSYDGEPAILFHGLTGSNWDDTYALAEKPSKADLFSWFNQIAHVADLFCKAGFNEIDFRPSNILLLNNPLEACGTSCRWFVTPRFEENAERQDAWNSIGGDSLAPTSLSAFVALIYRSISGMRLKPAAFIKESAYIKSPNLTEGGNNLIASTLSATHENVAQIGYSDFMLELSRSEQMGLVDLAPLPSNLIKTFPAEFQQSDRPPQLQTDTPAAAMTSSTPDPHTHTNPATQHSDVGLSAQSASTPPALPPTDINKPTSALPPQDGSASSRPQNATPAIGNKRTKMIFVATLFIIGIASVTLIFKKDEVKTPSKEVSSSDYGNNKSKSDNTLENDGMVTPVELPPSPAVSYTQVNLTQIPWLLPGAGFTFFKNDGASVINPSTVPETGTSIGLLAAMFSEEQLIAGAPYTLVANYKKEGVADVKIRMEEIQREHFITDEDNPSNLILNFEGLTASIEGWLAPKLVPVIENNPSAFNNGAPIPLTQGDFIHATIHYPAGSESKTKDAKFVDNRFRFSLDNVTGIPELRISSALFKQETSFPIRPPFLTPKAALNMVPVNAEPKQVGIWLDKLILEAAISEQSPLRNRIKSHKPKLTIQNSTAMIMKNMDYDVKIMGGAFDELVIANVRASQSTRIELPKFPTGYASGLNTKTPYVVNNKTVESPSVVALIMPENELWRCVIIGFDTLLNDGKGDFHKTQGIMRPVHFDPSSKKIDFRIDFDPTDVAREEAFSESKVFKDASIQFPISWETRGDEKIFPVEIRITGKKNTTHVFQARDKSRFEARSKRNFIKYLNDYFLHWALWVNTENYVKSAEETPTDQEIEIKKKDLLEELKQTVVFPKEAEMLGRNAFRIVPFDQKSE